MFSVPTLKKSLPGCFFRCHPHTPRNSRCILDSTPIPFGENILKREAQCGSKGTDKPPHVEGQLGDGGQQDAANDGDE